MRVLIVGGSGFIGRYLARWLGEERGHEVIGTFLSHAPPDDGNSWHRVELTDAAGLEQVFRLARPDVVAHLAAVADVGTAEREPARATAVNVAATSSIARLCELHGARLVFVSTEYVFDGQRGYYREDDPPNPITHYGRTKWEAERETARLASNWSVLRTSIVYGWPHPGKRNFAPWLIERLRSGQPYHASTDVYRTPVYVEHLVDGIAGLVEGEHQGIHHVAGRDWISMYDFGVAIAGAFDLDRRLVIQDADDSRPADMLGLDCAGTMDAMGLDQPGLVAGLTAMRASAPSASSM